MIIWGTGLSQMIIWRGRPLTNDYPEGTASCKWSSRVAGPLANDHPEGPNDQMIVKNISHLQILSSSPFFFTSTNNIFSFIIYSSMSFSVFLRPAKDIFSLSKFFLLFLLCFSALPQTKFFFLQILSSFSFSVQLLLQRPKTHNSRIIGQNTHNLLGLLTLSFSVVLFIHKNMD